VPNAGLLPAAVLAQRIDLAGWVDQWLELAEHGANSAAKALTVMGSMLTGGDTRGHRRRFRQLDAVSRELLGRLWAAGVVSALEVAGPPRCRIGHILARRLRHHKGHFVERSRNVTTSLFLALASLERLNSSF
jgi:hypothetical protein